MPAALDPNRRVGDPNPGRARGVTVVALSLDIEAYQCLKEMAPTTKSYGAYLSRLVFEERARREERQRLLQEARTPHE